MSTQVPGSPPQAPPAPPAPPDQTPVGVAFHEDGEPRGTVQVTRNVPPKRVMVLQGSITYAGVSYGPGDTFLCGEGPVCDAWQFNGLVSILDHEQVDEWNGKEGDAVRASAARHIENSHVAEAANVAFHGYLRGDATPAELHKTIEEARSSAPEVKIEDVPGFGKYENADGPDAEPSEHTSFRTQAAAEQLATGTTMEQHQEARRQKRQQRNQKGGE